MSLAHCECVLSGGEKITENVEINVKKCKKNKKVRLLFILHKYLSPVFVCEKESLMVINQQAKLFLHKCCPLNDSAN